MAARKRHHFILLALVGLAAVLAVVAVMIFSPFEQDPEQLQGQVEVGEYHVLGKVPGRILEICVSEGDYVNVGDTLAIIDAPEVHAYEKPVPGARSVLQQAKVALELAEQSYQRFQRLFDEGVVSATTRDEAYANYMAMEAQYEAAKGQGFGNINHETVQTAQMEGEVSNIYSKVGELVDLGSPIMTIAMMQNLWGTFLVPEDRLNGMEVGKTFKAFVPAFNQDIVMQVCYMSDQGVADVWKDDQASGQKHQRTFEVKARPTEQHESLRPGMLLVIK